METAGPGRIARMLEGGRVRHALPFATAAVVVLVGVMSYRAVAVVQTASGWVEHTREVSSELLELRGDLLLLSRFHRTYVVLGDPAALEQYRRTRGAMEPHLARLRELLQDNPKSRANLLALDRLIAPLVQTLDQHLRPNDLAAFARTDGELDRAGALLHVMASEENALLASRRASRQRSLTTAQYVIGGGTALAFLLGLLSNLSMGRLASRREAAEVRRKAAAVIADQAQGIARTSAERYRALVEASAQIVWTRSPDGSFAGQQPGWSDFTGQTSAELAGWGWLDALHPADRAECEQRWRADVAAGRISEQECRVRRHDGEYRRMSIRAVPLREADGTVREWVGAHSDVTDRRRAEVQRERLIGELERRNQELDQFAYATSHDLKAPLRGVVNVAQWLEEDLGSALGAEGRRMLHLMRGRIQRMEALIEGILRFSRVGRDAVPSEAVDTGALLREVVELATPPEDAAIELPSSAPTILTQRVLLQQVLLNLVSNAFKHCGKTNPHLGIEVHDLGAALEFVLHDDGPGIDPAYHQRIFRMFQTLESRDKVEGAGIGLAVVQKIVDTVGGKIGVESAVGQGSTFRVAWPKQPGAMGAEWNA